MVAATIAVSSGCSDTSSSESAGTSSEGAEAGGVTEDDLLSAPIPALCGHEPGSLANGKLPLQDPFYGFVSIAANSFAPSPTDDLMVALGDIDGDGLNDGAFVTSCSAGGVAWPATIQVYTSGPTNGLTHLGGVDLGAVTHGREIVKLIEIADGVVKVDWMTNSETDGACCPTVPVSADLRWTGSEMVVENMIRG